DRLGIRTLARGGYMPGAMASMFERMQAVSRTNQGGERERLPDYLKTHPVTTTRISEAKQRAEQMAGGTMVATTATPDAVRVERVPRPGPSIPESFRRSDNPLLPAALQLPDGGLDALDSVQYGWARERLRVLSANTSGAAIREYEQMQRGGALDDAQRYGLGLARLRDGDGARAAAAFSALLQDYPG